jgi:hypothetical protein
VSLNPFAFNPIAIDNRAGMGLILGLSIGPVVVIAAGVSIVDAYIVL